MTTTGLQRARRPKGSGTLTEIAGRPGVWRLRVFVGRDPVTGAPRQVSRTIRTKARGGRTAAEAALRKLVGEVDAGKHVGTSASVSVLLDHWLAELERQGRSPNTIDTYRQYARLRIRPRLGDVKLSDLTAHHLDRFYGWLASEEHLAVGTIRLHHSMLSGALSLAVRWSWISQSPAAHARPPAEEVTDDRETISPADVLRLIVAAEQDDKDMAALLALAALTGTRRGELIGLRWSDVDLGHKTIRVARALVPATGGQREGPPKGRKARVLAIGDAGVAVLERYAAELAERGTPARPDGWLLSYDGGVTPLKGTRVSEYVSGLGRRLDPPVAVHLHELRHFSVTELLGAGVDILAVSKRHGHSSVSITGDIYGHTLPARDQEAAAILGRLLAPALAPSDESEPVTIT